MSESVKLALVNQDNFVLPEEPICDFKLETNVSFTKDQLNKYTEFWLETNSLKFKLYMLANQLLMLLRRVKNKLLN